MFALVVNSSRLLCQVGRVRAQNELGINIERAVGGDRRRGFFHGLGGILDHFDLSGALVALGIQGLCRYSDRNFVPGGSGLQIGNSIYGHDGMIGPQQRELSWRRPESKIVCYRTCQNRNLPPKPGGVVDIDWGERFDVGRRGRYLPLPKRACLQRCRVGDWSCSGGAGAGWCMQMWV